MTAPNTQPPVESGSGFTRAGVLRGLRTAVPLLLGLIPFALVVGVVSAGRGLSLAETTVMSAVVFAGSAQLLGLELWSDPAPWLAAALAAFFVNLRLLPMGAALTPWFARARGWRTWLTLGFLTDHGFALSIPEERAGRRDAGFLLGTGLLLWVGWTLFCAAGHVMGGLVRLPPGHPLYFAAPAAFIALLVPMWRSRAQDLAPWFLAGFLALAAWRLHLPVPLPLLIGALGGAALGALRQRRRERAA
ncbi:AzlC family ABC transporter permease [Roseomonas elaeocarpi]|uniref:AzlC family ABC transporter permease n=1 Tax=Roseomonas elaeocarpi TaxID=907779 RepID=A0ABV6JRS9_9PROT